MDLQLIIVVIGFILSLIATIARVSMSIQKLKSDIINVKDRACRDLEHVNEKLEDYKIISNGVLKEIKDDVKDLKEDLKIDIREVKEQLMKLIQTLPKRSGE